MGNSKKHESKSKKKHKHKERKEKKKKPKKHSKVKRTDKKEKECKQSHQKGLPITDEKLNDDFSIPVELMSNKSHAPETPEEYRKRQSRIRREIDPVTGRSRLIKGDGEVIEEIVSKERHIAINREATKGDGEFFQDNVLSKR